MRPSLRLGLISLIFSICGRGAAQELPEVPAPDLADRPVMAVASVVDARTLLLEREGKQQRVRLLGVAWPREEADRAAAVGFLERLLTGERVRVIEPDEATGPADGHAAGETEEQAGSGAEEAEAEPSSLGPRVLVYREPDKLLVNLELIRQGYAPVAARPDFELQRTFRVYELHAREIERGIWRVDRATAQTAPPPPAAGAAESLGQANRQPANAPGTADGQFVVYVTKSGRKYHLADCQYVRSGASAIALAQAREKYEPCSRCEPPQ